MSSLPRLLYLWRAYNRLSQREAADVLNVHLTTWSRWERGITRPNQEQISTLDYYTMHDPTFRFPPGTEGGVR
jgi:transcriptional regulator with XRE-family HTH domain